MAEKMILWSFNTTLGERFPSWSSARGCQVSLWTSWSSVRLRSTPAIFGVYSPIFKHNQIYHNISKYIQISDQVGDVTHYAPVISTVQLVGFPCWGSVPRLGLRIFSLRTTSMIYGYSLNRKIYRWIWTWFQEACTCVLEMIIRTLSLNHMLTHAFHAESQVTSRDSSVSLRILLECYVTTYQGRLESDLQNMLQRIRIHHAGPLNPTHVPAPCPQVLP